MIKIQVAINQMSTKEATNTKKKNSKSDKSTS